ncbi:MAG: hypothetical protein V1843_03940 [bacterium]
MKKISLFVLGMILLFSSHILGAVGCDLNDPDRDVKRFFPQMSNYRTDYFSVKKLGGDVLYSDIQQRFGDKFKGRYETIDVPYTVYTIYQGKKIIGYIHGVNQKGKYGGLQVFLALDPRGIIIDQYFQKMTASYAGKFRDRSFGVQFRGLGLKDFLRYNVVTDKAPPGSTLSRIKNPVNDGAEDFSATMRGIKKNLILMDVFVFKGRG